MLTHLDDFSRTLKIERNYSNNTISSYLSDLKSFDSFLEKNRINFKELNNKHTKLFFRNLSKKKFSPRTIKRKFSSLSSYFSFLLDRRIIKNKDTFFCLPKWEAWTRLFNRTYTVIKG